MISRREYLASVFHLVLWHAGHPGLVAPFAVAALYSRSPSWEGIDDGIVGARDNDRTQDYVYATMKKIKMPPRNECICAKETRKKERSNSLKPARWPFSHH